MEQIYMLKNKMLRISIGIVYFIFGILKFFPSLSPAEELAKNTINTITMDLLPTNLGLLMLAIGETSIGIFLLLNWKTGSTLKLAILHIILTFSPFFIFPELIFGDKQFALTLVGQYIIKNLIILSALLSLKIELEINSGYQKKNRFINSLFPVDK